MDSHWIESKIQELESLQFASGPQVAQTGVSLAIVRDGRLSVTYARGWANRESRIPVTTGTVFPIASLTKAFTATLLAHAYFERGLDLNHPVSQLLPEFSLAQVAISRQITPVDLLAHRSGLPRHDALWYRAGLEGPEIFQRLRHLELSPPGGQGFRTSFQYNNLLYGVAGALLERLTGHFWSDMIQEQICGPLGMPRTTAFAPHHLRIDRALPYFREQGCQDFLHWACAPAGSMYSTAPDMARWLELQMARGKNREGQTLIDGSLFESFIWKPWNDAAKTPEAARCYEQTKYGLGWFIDQFAGQRLIHHSGSITGYSLHASFMPDCGLGLVILVNQVQSGLNRPLASALYSSLLGIDEPRQNTATETPIYSRQSLFPLHLGEPELTADEIFSRRQLSQRSKDALIRRLGSRAWIHPGYGTIRFQESTSSDCDLWVSYENAAPWSALLINESTLLARVEWLGMPCRLLISISPNEVRIPFNLNPGCDHTVFRSSITE